LRTVIERINAVSDAGGQYQLVHYQNWAAHSGSSGESPIIKASTEWQTSTGNHVESKDDDCFELIQTGERLRRS